jgi:hypothetical protein
MEHRRPARSQDVLTSDITDTVAGHHWAVPLEQAPARARARSGGAGQRRVAGFEVVVALIALGPGYHPLGAIADRSGLSNSSACRLLRLAEEQYGLVWHRQGGFYALTALGRAQAAPTTTPPLAAFDEHPWLTRLNQETGEAALLYGTSSRLPGVTSRHLLRHVLGSMRERILAAPYPEQLELIHTLPLEREDAVCQARSPIEGLDFLAAPAWGGPTIEAILTLLIDSRTPRATRVKLAHSLATAAAGYSRQITASADTGARLRQAS